MESDFTIIEGSPNSNVILHIPHSSRFIPDHIKDTLLISGEPLSFELDLMTDTHTDTLALESLSRTYTEPWIFKNNISRFVFDPERFPDNTEPMNEIGMGAVYKKTSSGADLRLGDSEFEEYILNEYFFPYAESLEKLVTSLLSKHGSVYILDLHSYRKIIGINELNGDLQRPEICFGLDPFHTNESLYNLAFNSFSSYKYTAINQPFSGTYVPLKYYNSNPNVKSIMLEIRDDCLVDSGLKISMSFHIAVDSLANLINKL